MRNDVLLMLLYQHMLAEHNEYVFSEKRFRSPYVHRYSDIAIYVNVQGWLTATTLATRAPGGKIAAPRFPQLIPPGYRAGRDVTSL